MLKLKFYRPKPYYPGNPNHLILGECDFSFAVSVSNFLEGDNIFATSYANSETVYA